MTADRYGDRKVPPRESWAFPHRLLTIDQVAELTQLPVGGLRKQRIENKFCPAYKLGRHLRWDSFELWWWVQDHKDPV